MRKYQFGDKITWTHKNIFNNHIEIFRAIFDCTNKNGDAIILMHPKDFDRKQISWGHHDVKYTELTKGWKQ